ncbi:MAG: orotidine 5'-phosphate decarboxylase / HUMPS family protein, partial [Deferribacterota bacterium]|nr:orotidine 5'-phosphate decarboxylase / HUMPS family protein [Deferribacterota bacterium]
EASYIREVCGEDFKIISPGIRLASSDKQDQKRVYTPLDAKKVGVNYIVVGRLITTSNNKNKVINRIFEELND